MSDIGGDIHSFVRRHGVKLSCSHTTHNPHMDDEWGRSADHWRCTLRCGRRSMRVTFSKGSGHHGKAPTVDEVLDNLASDAGGELSSFESWAGDYGYDLDSYKARKTFNAVKKQAASLKRLLGPEAFEELVYRTERL